MAFCISQKSQKDADLVVLAYFSGQIHVSQQPFIQSIWFQGHFRLVLSYSFHWLRLILEAETFSSIFLLSEMPLSKAAILVYEQNHKVFKMPPTLILILYVSISLICTNFEAFITFSAIFTHICQTKKHNLNSAFEPSMRQGFVKLISKTTRK